MFASLRKLAGKLAGNLAGKLADLVRIANTEEEVVIL